MKLKTFFLAGLVSAAGALSLSAAGDVFSVNAVGFVNITVPAGTFKIVTNPLKQGDNTLATILPSVPVGTKVYKFNANQTFTIYTMIPGTPNRWSGTDVGTTEFKPGEGFFVKAPSGGDLNLTFVGEVAQGDLTINVPVGFSLIAAHVPQSASLTTDLKLTALTGDRVYFFRNNAYVIVTRLASSWSAPAGVLDVNGEPRPEVAEGFFFQNKHTPITWARNFSANN